MESINTILEDSSIPEPKKLEQINILLDTKLERDKGNVKIEHIFKITTENTELKCDVLRKTFLTGSNFEENIKYFINYFKDTFYDLGKHELLAKCLLVIFEKEKNSNEIQNLLNRLGIENVDNVLLNELFLQNIDYEESPAILISYLNNLSIDYQSVFFNHLFEFSQRYQNVEFLCLTFEIIDKAALIQETSVLRTKRFWNYLSNCLVNSKDFLEAKMVTFMLLTCIHLIKTTKLDLPFLSVDNDEKAWDAFVALVQVTNYGKQELITPSLVLLKSVSSLHYFWQDCVFKLLINHVRIHLKCSVLVLILKQKPKEENLGEFLKIIFRAINERQCTNKECPVFKELNLFCENVVVKNFPIILDEILNVSWIDQNIWKVLKCVLVDSKKNLLDFEYFFRIMTHLNGYNFNCWSRLEQISRFFWDPENFEMLCQISGSAIPFSTSQLPHPEGFKNRAIEKIIELSSRNSDDLKEISMYIGFIKDKDTYIKMMQDYNLSIHVRIVIYGQLFVMYGYNYAQRGLDQDATINDFYEYLVNHLNEKTYVTYRELMLSFLGLLHSYMGFAEPEKACSEILNIIRNPELYSKYQIYCAAQIVRWVTHIFKDLWGRDEEYYKIAQKWKVLILETDDPKTCEEGLFYVLEKGQLDAEEYNKIVKDLLEKNICNEVSEAIFRRYLNVDLLNFAFNHLIYITEKYPLRGETFSNLFCETIFSDKYFVSDQFCLENEYLKFCFSSSKNLETSIRAMREDVNYLEYKEYQFRIVDSTIAIYLNKLSNLQTKIECLSVLMREVAFNLGRLKGKNFKMTVKHILDRFKEMYAVNLDNDVNKLRIAQALNLLVRYVTRDGKDYEELKHYFKRIVVGILVKESNSRNYAVRQICQYMYTLSCEDGVTFNEVKCIIAKIKERPDMAGSFMPLLYHLMPFGEFGENEVEEILSSVFSLSLVPDNKPKIYAQILFQRVYNLYNTIFENGLEKYESNIRQIESDVESHKDKVADTLGADYVYINIFDPTRDRSLETSLYILPKLNQVDPSEWKDVLKYNYFIGGSKMNGMNDKHDTLNKAVNLFLETNGKNVKYSAEDILNMFKAPSQNPVLEKFRKFLNK